MTPDLEDRLRTAYRTRTQHLPVAGPGLPVVGRPRTPAHDPVRRTSSARRWSMVAAAMLVVAAIGLVTLRLARSEPVSPSYPPGLLDGTSGSEITMTDVTGTPTGDGFVLEASPAGGRMTVQRRAPDTSGPMASTNDGTVMMLDASELCASGTATAGACYSDLDPHLFLGDRKPGGQALVVQVPPGTFAVLFSSGSVRYWARPLHGAAVFPYDDAAASTATATVVDGDGRTLLTLQDHNPTMSNAEVDAAAVVHVTSETLDRGWLARPANDEPNPTSVTVRNRGRSGGAGFAGPFIAQSIWLRRDGIATAAAIITVRTTDAGDAVRRLDDSRRGGVRQRLDHPDGTTVLIWADAAIDDDQIAGTAASLTAGLPPADAVRLDAPFAFTGPVERDYFGIGALQPLLTDQVPNASGHEIRLETDDVGDVRIALVDPGGYTMAVQAGPHTTDGCAFPAVGDVVRQLSCGPPGLDVVEITLDDGTTITPELVDLRPTADVTLLLIADPTDQPIRHVASS